MKKVTRRQVLPILCCFIAGFVLTVLPLPPWADNIRPLWIVLLVIYWVMAIPNRINLGIAWFCGLLLDALSNTLLGEQALALLLVAYIAYKLHRRVRVYPLWQQAVTVMFMCLSYLSVVYLIQGSIGLASQSLWFWFPSVSSMLLWPWIYLMLRDLQRRFAIE